MALNLTKLAIGVGVGVADTLLEQEDAKKGRSGIKSWSSIGRGVAVLGGLGIGYVMPRYAGLGESIANASVALFTKTVMNEVMKGTSGAGTSFFAARNVAGPSTRNWVPTGGGGGYRSMRATN